MKITRKQLRKLIRESYRTAAGGNRPPWADDPLPEPAPPPAPKPPRARKPRKQPDARMMKKVKKLGVSAGKDWAADTLGDARRDSSMWEGQYSSAEEYVSDLGQTAASDTARGILEWSGDESISEWYSHLPTREDYWSLDQRPVKWTVKDIVADAFYEGVTSIL